jgi:hypothetical protein
MSKVITWMQVIDEAEGEARDEGDDASELVYPVDIHNAPDMESWKRAMTPQEIVDQLSKLDPDDLAGVIRGLNDLKFVDVYPS